MWKLEKITIANYDEKVASGIVVIDFFAERCGPCKVISPVLDQMSQDLAGKVSFYTVDVDEEEDLSSREAIRAMPTLKVYQNGKLVETIVGANIPKLQEIVNWLLASAATAGDMDISAKSSMAA